MLHYSIILLIAEILIFTIRIIISRTIIATNTFYSSTLLIFANYFFFPIYLTLSAALGPSVHPASNRNEYLKLEGLSPRANYTDRATAACQREMRIRNRKIMFLGSRARSVRRADNLTAICEPHV
jgi:hypothetical protein